VKRVHAYGESLSLTRMEMEISIWNEMSNPNGKCACVLQNKVRHSVHPIQGWQVLIHLWQLATPCELRDDWMMSRPCFPQNARISPDLHH
jgi:hypothetical protein